MLFNFIWLAYFVLNTLPKITEVLLPSSVTTLINSFAKLLPSLLGRNKTFLAVKNYVNVDMKVFSFCLIFFEFFNFSFQIHTLSRIEDFLYGLY